jgi:hypothetical protein
MRSYSAGRPHGRLGSMSPSVIGPAPGSRAPTRRYLQPESGCHRRKRRGCFVCIFMRWWTRYLDSVSAAGPVQISLSLLFLELSSYYLNAVQLHVHAADVLGRRGIDRDGSR